MAARLIEPYMTYHTSNGVSPLSGGKLKFFVAGTVSTNKDTFSDDTLLTANPNPIVLDSAGRVPDTVVDVWGDGDYDMVVADSSDVEIERFDNVNGGVGLTTLTNIASLTELLKSSLVNGDEFDVSGYFTQGDGGGGRFFWDSTSTDTANGGTIIISDEGGTGRWMRIFTGAINIRWFGAKGDGVDDTTAHDNACAYLEATGGTLYFPGPGTYAVNTPIVFTRSIEIFRDNGAVIDVSGMISTDPALYDFQGAKAQIENLSVNAVIGENTVTFASAPSLVVGDVFIIFNPTTFSWSGFDQFFFAGEWCEVIGVSGNVATLSNSLYDDYAFGDVDIYKVTLLQPKVHDLEIIGGDVINCLRFQFCTGQLTENLTLFNANNTLIFASRCYKATMTMTDGYNAGDGGDDYGISVANSQDIVADGGNIYSRRHACTTGGNSEICAVTNRNIRFKNLTLKNDISSGVHNADFHGNIEDGVYENCTIWGGVTWQGKNSGYSNCKIYPLSNGSVLNAANIKGGTFYLDNCDMVTYEDPQPTSAGIVNVGGNSSAITASSDEDMTFRIRGGRVFGRNMGATGAILRYGNNGSTNKINVDIQGLEINMDDFGQVLQTALNSGTAASDFTIIDNITTNVTGRALAVHGGADYRVFPHRLPKQVGSQVIETTAASTTVGLSETFNWIYPRDPVVMLTQYEGTFAGSVRPIPGSHTLSTSAMTPRITSPDGGTSFPAGTDVTVAWSVELAEI